MEGRDSWYGIGAVAYITMPAVQAHDPQDPLHGGVSEKQHDLGLHPFDEAVKVRSTVFEGDSSFRIRPIKPAQTSGLKKVAFSDEELLTIHSNSRKATIQVTASSTCRGSAFTDLICPWALSPDAARTKTITFDISFPKGLLTAAIAIGSVDGHG
jgi:hypothetical protein